MERTAVGEVTHKTERQSVGFDDGDVDHGAVEVAHIAADAGDDGGGEVGRPCVGFRVGSDNTRLGGRSELPIVAGVFIVARRSIPIQVLVKVVPKGQGDDMESVVFVEKAVVGGVKISVGLLPDVDHSGAEGEDVLGKADECAGTWHQGAGPNEVTH